MTKTRQLIRNRKRSGYILLYCLVLIALASMILSGVASHSLQVSMDAQHAIESLQRQWTVYSCQRAILPLAAEAFEEVGETNNGQNPGDEISDNENPDDEYSPEATRSLLPASIIAETVSLDGFDLELVLGDENAKLNMNQILKTQGISAVRSTLTENLDLRSALKPKVSNLDQNQPRPVRGWHQLFDLSVEPTSSDPLDEIRTLSHAVSCWGNGKLNPQRAAHDSVYRVAKSTIGNRIASRLIDQLTEAPDRSMADTITALGLRERDEKKLRKAFTTGSTTFSLWITLKSKTRTWHRLFVLESELVEDDETTESNDENDSNPTDIPNTLEGLDLLDGTRNRSTAELKPPPIPLPPNNRANQSLIENQQSLERNESESETADESENVTVLSFMW